MNATATNSRKKQYKPKNTILKEIEVLRLFQDLYPEIPSQAIEVFLWVAYKEEIHQSDLMDITGMHQASVSRNVALLSDWTRHRTPGPDLVDSRRDPYEKRKRILFLTENGKRLKKQIEELLG